jgi:hypothetical protein
MTRRKLRTHLTGTFVLLGTVLFAAFLARFVYPMLADGDPAVKVLQSTYDYVKDMSLLIITCGAVYLTNVYQKRASFIDSLKEEWRAVLHAKSALLHFTHLEAPTTEQYVTAFNILSETIDNMRIVYRNVGETGDLVGLYPFAPLHDMRRALQTINPRKSPTVSEDQRKLVRDCVLQSFYAMREVFLEELDLEEPTRPLLIHAGRRSKRSGSTRKAEQWQARQRKRQDRRAVAGDPAIDTMLTEEYRREQSTAKPWRDVPAHTGAGSGRPNGGQPPA